MLNSYLHFDVFYKIRYIFLKEGEGLSDFSEKPGAFGIFFEKFESCMLRDIVLVSLNLMIVRKYSFRIFRIRHRSVPNGMGYLFKTQLKVGMTNRVGKAVSTNRG